MPWRSGRADPILPEAVAVHAGGAWERVGQLALILGLATLIMGMGLADDRVGLGWKLRLGVQVAWPSCWLRPECE